MPEPVVIDKNLNEEAQKVFAAFKEHRTWAEKEIKTRGEETSEVKERVDKIEADFDKYQDAVNKTIAELQAAALSRSSDTSEKESEDDAIYKRAFEKWARGGTETKSARRWKLDEKELEILEKKSISTDAQDTGGYLLPQAAQGELIKNLRQYSPIEELATNVTITQGNTWEAPGEGTTTFASGWVSERQSRTETTAGKLRMVVITAHEMYANPFVSQTSLDDLQSFEEWISGALFDEFRVTRNAAFAVGDSNGKPGGLFVNATAQTNSVVSGNATALTADGFIDFMLDLPDYYANSPSSVVLFKRATLKELRKLKSSDNYLWAPGFDGNPPTIDGKNYRECPDAPTIGAGTYPIAFGDIRRAYLVVNRAGIRTTRDPYTSKPMVEFYTTARVGGEVVLAEAYRLHKVSA